MNFDENKTFAEMAIGEAIDDPTITLCRQTEPIREYLLRHLGIDFSLFTSDRKELLQKNFIYIICLAIKDLKAIESRIEEYSAEYRRLNSDGSNTKEYHRKKIEYFCRINKDARIEIINFLQTGLKEYLLENKFDALKREEEADELSEFFLNRRYRYAYLRDYYDINYDYATCVKISYLPGIKLENLMKMEKHYLSLKDTNPQEYKVKMHKLIDDKKIMDCVVTRVTQNYHLCKRKEIFENMNEVFSRKNYQPFLALGLLQLEGMFYDFCQIKFGDKENMGTLVEKVQKSLYGCNEYRYMRFYPYFSFDVPIMRNEIAHKGMMENAGLEEAAYNLVLDLNAVSSMVKEESYDKFIVFLMTHEEMLKLDYDALDSPVFEKEMNKKLVFELMRISEVANDYFWKVLKNPKDYEEELRFYTQDDLPEGYVDLPEIVLGISGLLRREGFWEGLYNQVNECMEKNKGIPKILFDFAKRLKNEYISELTDGAKNECIKLAKIIKQTAEVSVL